MSPFVLPVVPSARTKEIVSNTFIMFSNISRQKRIPLRTTPFSTKGLDEVQHGLIFMAGAPIARSLPQTAKLALNLFPEPMTSDQLVSVLLIWQLGHVEQGADVFAETPYD